MENIGVYSESFPFIISDNGGSFGGGLVVVEKWVTGEW